MRRIIPVLINATATTYDYDVLVLVVFVSLALEGWSQRARGGAPLISPVALI